MAYSELFTKDSVLLNLDGGDSTAVLGALTDALCAKNPELKDRRDEVLETLIERESRGSTGTDGVGLPHVKMAGVTQVTVVVGVHQAGVEFNALDGEKVHVFFSVIRPEEGADEHIGLLRWLAGIAQHEDFVSFSCQATSKEELIALLSELASTSA